ncbi:hypothetical protein NSE01_23950 [Novosphingobium sediminis]|uniref:3'-5' exonuclease n=1 Tax=Novosphingobium sediminis TaxID=707214 RepID=A0A512ALH8_9SPHN|nr:hypothetical protein [Novosphingobium sediminis]GEO00563.1 hypothetical protein NSE01_23950 [Novosphingobium sediminis]
MKTFNTPANAGNAAPATQHFTFFDIETHWDEALHANYCFIQHAASWPPRIGARRVHAAAAFDLALAADGAITCERIASWTLPRDGDERGVVEGLFTHMRARPAGTCMVGYGSIAMDVPVLKLAAMEYGLVLPDQLIASAGDWKEAWRPHLDLGLAIKGQGKTWHHLTEILVRLGIQADLLRDKARVGYPQDLAGWAELRSHVELDTVLTAAATMAWARSQGHAGIDPATASHALLQWWSRHGALSPRFVERVGLASSALWRRIGSKAPELADAA